MKTLEDFTPEIRAKIDAYKKRCTEDLYSGKEHENFNREKSVKYIEKVYEIAKMDKPVIFFAEDPIEYGKLFRQIHHNQNVKKIGAAFESKNKESETPDLVSNLVLADKFNDKVEIKSHHLFLCSTYHRVYLTWYKFIQDEFGISHTNEDLLNYLYENANNNISRAYFTKLFVLVLKTPRYIRRNNIGFHSVDLPAIEWDNYKMYYINGRRIQEDIFKRISDKVYTFDDFIYLQDEDIKATVISMISEKHGHDYLKDFLGAFIADEQTIDHTSGYSETVRLWKTKEKYPFLCDINDNPNQPYAWLELHCPSSDSVYMIQTSAHFDSAIECCKYHRPNVIPMELSYNFTKFNN